MKVAYPPIVASTHSDFAGAAGYTAAAVFVVSLARFFVVPVLRLPANSAAVAELNGLLPAIAHLLLFPIVATLPSPTWARAAGYGWLVIDICTDVMALNGVSDGIYLPLRYGGHVSAALWIFFSSLRGGRSIQLVGCILAAELCIYSFIAPWAPLVVLYPSLLLLPLWLVLVVRRIAQAPAAYRWPGRTSPLS